jgi:hypothetical protein
MRGNHLWIKHNDPDGDFRSIVAFPNYIRALLIYCGSLKDAENRGDDVGTTPR